MGLFGYTLFLWLYRIGIRLAQPFNPKAAAWVKGRQSLLSRLQVDLANAENVIWMHCASLGEFEQGRPLLEKLRVHYPRHRLLLTFFSPSGFEIRKNYAGADWVYYLPLDGPSAAVRFMDIVKPSLVIFVKYEFWYYYLREIRTRNIPLLLVSAIFRENAVFFKWYGGLQRRMLRLFTHLFVQDEASIDRLKKIEIANATVAGDTRFDRVIEIAEGSMPPPGLAAFLGTAKALIAGSTWPPDEQLLKKLLPLLQQHELKLIIAPHEIGVQHIDELLALFPGAVLYSRSSVTNTASVMIIDNIGLLSVLYRHAHTCYVGGGFGKGIHNILEAAVYGKPVLFGPEFEKFREAHELLKAGGAFAVEGESDARTVLAQLLESEANYLSACAASRNYVYGNRGATDKIVRYIQENRLLTS